MVLKINFTSKLENVPKRQKSKFALQFGCLDFVCDWNMGNGFFLLNPINIINNSIYIWILLCCDYCPCGLVLILLIYNIDFSKRYHLDHFMHVSSKISYSIILQHTVLSYVYLLQRLTFQRQMYNSSSQYKCGSSHCERWSKGWWSSKLEPTGLLGQSHQTTSCPVAKAEGSSTDPALWLRS